MFLNPSTTTLEKERVDPQAAIGRQIQHSNREVPLQHVLEQLPPKSVAEFLCSSCFELGTDSFFYFDQGWFKQGLDELYANEDSTLRQDCTFLCIVLMTLALGSQFAHLRATNTQSTIHGTGHYPGLMFYNSARSLIPYVVEAHSVEAVQACFIMSVYLLPAHAYDTSYFYMGLALRIAIALDLHQSKGDAHLSVESEEARRRLWWSVYSLERTVSIKLGRPRSIDANNISAPLPAPLPTLDRIQRFDNIYHQIANAELVKIMDRIALEMPNTFDPRNPNTLNWLKHKQRDLQRWKANLPPALREHSLMPRETAYRTVVHLHLNYANAWIILCRLPLLFLVRERLKKAFVNPDMELLRDSQVERLAKDCTEAAQKMIGHFETLQRAHSLAKFSFTDFQGCSTATIIMLLQSIYDANAPHSPYIASGLACLRFMASGSDKAKIGVRFVEEFQSLADEASARIRQSLVDEIARAPNDDNMAAYEEWLRSVAPSIERPHEPPISAPREAILQARRDAPRVMESALVETVSAITADDPIGSIQATPIDGQYHALASGNTLGDGLGDLGQIDDMLPAYPLDLDDTFILGLTGLDTLDFTDQTYWPH